MKKLIKLFAVINCLSSIAIIFTPTVSWGVVDGKGLYCLDTHLGTTEKWFTFVDGNVQFWEIQLQPNEQYEIKKVFQSKLIITPNFLMWKQNDTNFYLSRKTLLLKINELRYLNCEVFDKTYLKLKLSQKKHLLQSEYDEKTKDNKI